MWNFQWDSYLKSHCFPWDILCNPIEFPSDVYEIFYGIPILWNPIEISWNSVKISIDFYMTFNGIPIDLCGDSLGDSIESPITFYGTFYEIQQKLPLLSMEHCMGFPFKVLLFFMDLIWNSVETTIVFIEHSMGFLLKDPLCSIGHFMTSHRNSHLLIHGTFFMITMQNSHCFLWDICEIP